MEIRGSTTTPVSYATLGDWHYTSNGFDIPFVDTGCPECNLMLFVHELVEAFLCRLHGIGESTVTDFDKNFQGDYEPGDDIHCPYRNEHHAAELVEKYLARILEFNWKEYQRICEDAYNAAEARKKS